MAAPPLPRALPDFPAPRRSLPRGSASSLARGGVPSEPTKADKSASSASGSLLYSETATAAAKIPFTPRVLEPRWIAAASVFDVGAPVRAEPPSLPLAEGAAPEAAPPPSFGRPAAERAWRPGASPPGRAQRSRGAPRCASGAALGFRRPACSPLAVVASELTLGATAHEGRGRGGRAVTQGGVGSAARRPSSKPG